jgi:hypothetical protein
MKLRCAKALWIGCLTTVVGAPAWAQTACVDAPMQLQQYINQVNQTANYWYYQGIPQNCGVNQYCANAMLQQLNFWYQQQAGMVNQWYYQIAVSCTNQAPTNQIAPRPADKPIDNNVVQELPVDQDSQKTVRIVIPDNPNGFRTH